MPPDFVETIKSVRPKVEAFGEGQDRPRVRAVQDGKVEEAVGRAEDLPEDLGREAGAPHPEQKGEVETVGADSLDDGRDLGEPLLHRLRAVEPAEAVCDLRRLRLPDGMVLPPDPFHDPPGRQGPAGLRRRRPAGLRAKRHSCRHGRSLPLQSKSDPVNCKTFCMPDAPSGIQISAVPSWIPAQKRRGADGLALPLLFQETPRLRRNRRGGDPEFLIDDLVRGARAETVDPHDGPRQDRRSAPIPGGPPPRRRPSRVTAGGRT